MVGWESRCCPGGGGFAEVPRIQNVGGFGEERMHLVQISCEAKVQGPRGSSPPFDYKTIGGWVNPFYMKASCDT